MLVSMKEILDLAKEGKYAIAAPNVDNEHNLRACIEAAEELDSPIIIGMPVHSQANADFEYFGRIVQDIAVRSSVPVAFNLDHGGTFEECILGIRSGFTSIMVDRSQEPYDINVRDTKEMVKIAHAVGVSVEAELGHVGGNEGDGTTGNVLTVPSEAKKFVEETGVDCLAVAIGTAHGFYKGEPNIRFDLLEEIAKEVSVPLVLHGGSGTGDENLARAAKLGICKVNLSIDLRQAAVDELNNTDLSGYRMYGIYKYLAKGYKDKLSDYINILGSAGKAQDWRDKNGK